MQLLNWLNDGLDEFELDLPPWLENIVMDELYYTAMLILLASVSFAVGLAVGTILVLYS
jgi:hypothetical protein